jgi:hypothetical protein
MMACDESLTSIDPSAVWIPRAHAITFRINSLVSLTGARAKRFSWWDFPIIVLLLWCGV